MPVVVNKVLLEHRHNICLCFVFGGFHVTVVDLSDHSRTYGLQSLNYSLSCPLQKKFPNLTLHHICILNLNYGKYGEAEGVLEWDFQQLFFYS